MPDKLYVLAAAIAANAYAALRHLGGPLLEHLLKERRRRREKEASDAEAVFSAMNRVLEAVQPLSAPVQHPQKDAEDAQAQQRLEDLKRVVDDGKPHLPQGAWSIAHSFLKEVRVVEFVFHAYYGSTGWEDERAHIDDKCQQRLRPLRDRFEREVRRIHAGLLARLREWFRARLRRPR
jgi:hypothetical protein